MSSSSTDQIAIARHPAGFVLYRRRTCREWTNLKLESVTPRRKNNWWFGCNGARLSRSSDARLLAEHHPDIYTWVIELLGVSP